MSGEESQDTLRQHREELFKKIHELHNEGLSGRKIAVLLNVHRETVGHYLKYNTCPVKRIVFTNKYEEHLDIINSVCKQGKNIKEIFSEIKKDGFKGQLTAFYSWFHKQYPNYDYKQTH